MGDSVVVKASGLGGIVYRPADKNGDVVVRIKGEKPLFHTVLDDIVERDYNDSHRAASPLMRAEDAVLLDTSSMTLKQSIREVVRLAKDAIGG